MSDVEKWMMAGAVVAAILIFGWLVQTLWDAGKSGRRWLVLITFSLVLLVAALWVFHARALP